MALDDRTLLTMASDLVTGKAGHTGEIIYSFVGGRLANTKPSSATPIKKISMLFKGYDLPSDQFHLVVKMDAGIPQHKEVKA